MFYPSSIWIKPLVLPNFSQSTLMHAQGKFKAGSEENKNISPRIQVAPILLRKALWVSFQKTTKCRESRAAAVRPHVWQPCQLLFHQWELWAKQVIFSLLRIILSFVFCTKGWNICIMLSSYNIRGLNIFTRGVKMQTKKSEDKRTRNIVTRNAG